MKLTKDLIGKKVTTGDWRPEEYATVLALASDGRALLETQNQIGITTNPYDITDWQLYQEPKQKKRIEAAPAVIKRNGEWHITTRTYSSFQDAKLDWGEHIIIWPCPFDKEKGVFYYEWEE